MRHGWIIATVMVSLMGRAGWAEAASLGIPLDGFLVTLLNWAMGLGFVIGGVGLVGWIGSMFDNPFAPILAGSIGFFTKAGLLGGGMIILPMLGLVQGALLP